MPLYPPYADQSIASRNLSDLARTGGWMPTGAIDETCPRQLISTTLAPTGGTLYLFGGVVIPAGRTVTTISFFSATGATLPTNQWFCLVDKSLNVLMKTADDTTTAWGNNATKTLTLSSSYTPTADIEVYLGCLQTATTSTAQLRCASGQATLSGITPVMTASSTTGLTNPASLGATAGALTSVATNAYAWVA